MAGSMAGIQKEAIKRGLLDQIKFVEFRQASDGTGKAVPMPLPLPPKGGNQGFAYIFNAGLSDTSGALAVRSGVNPTASIGGNGMLKNWSSGMTPLVTLEDVLPNWVDVGFFVKIDTQGWEAKIIKGMKTLLMSNKIEYLQYEFSPWLVRNSNRGDPLQLLEFLPSIGAVCFDMMGEHNKPTRPSKDLRNYFTALDEGLNGQKYEPSVAIRQYQRDTIGPWEDILCWFPAATK